MDTKPIKVSLAIPIHNMDNAAFFLRRLMQSLEIQTFKDFEIVITKEEGTMAQNTNAAIKKCKGEIVKIIYMDDFLASKTALETMIKNFKGGWLVTGSFNDDGQKRFNYHIPTYNPQIATGVNTIGSPSVLMFENKDPLLFDEQMNWLLDCDYYERLYRRYGEPTLCIPYLVGIGVGQHQTTNKLSEEEKTNELKYVITKYS